MSNLRIVDGSIFPSMPTVNPVITTMMIGERCAEACPQGEGGRPPLTLSPAWCPSRALELAKRQSPPCR